MAKSTSFLTRDQQGRSGSVIIDRLWQGASGQAPWQRHVGQVESAQNVRFDLTVGGAVKRNGLQLVADLTEAGSVAAPLDGATEYHFHSIGNTIIAIGDGECHAWDFNGTPYEFIDDSETSGFVVSSFIDYITGIDPRTDLAFTGAFDSFLVANRTVRPRITAGWTWQQIANFMENGDPASAASITTTTGPSEVAAYNDFEDMIEAHAPGGSYSPSSGDVFRTRADSNLDPAGYYLYWPGVTIHASAEGFFPEASRNYYRIPADQQSRARYNPATMPHRIVVDEDAQTITASECPWRHRISGNRNTNREMPWTAVGQVIRDVQFHQGRLFLIGPQHITSSRHDDFFNLFVDSINAIADNDRILYSIGISNVGKLCRCASVGENLIVTTTCTQMEFTSGDEPLTSFNGRVNQLTDYPVLDIEIGVAGNYAVIVDRYGDVHQYTYLGELHGIVYTSMLTAHYRNALFGYTIDHIVPIAQSIFILTDDDNAIMHDMFVVGNELVQSAWGLFNTADPIVFLSKTCHGGNSLRVVTRDQTSNGGYSLCSYLHRPVEPPAELPFMPYSDRLELVPASVMSYDPTTNRTVIPHTGKVGSLANSVLVTTSTNRTGVFVKPRIINGDGDPEFSGDWTDSDQYLGFRFDTELELTRFYPIVSSREFLIKRVTVFHQDTTDYDVTWIKSDGQTKTERWQAHKVGEAIIGAPSTQTHYNEVVMQGVDSRARITISSDSPGPMNISALEIEVISGGRGST